MSDVGPSSSSKARRVGNESFHSPNYFESNSQRRERLVTYFRANNRYIDDMNLDVEERGGVAIPFIRFDQYPDEPLSRYANELLQKSLQGMKENWKDFYDKDGDFLNGKLQRRLYSVYRGIQNFLKAGTVLAATAARNENFKGSFFFPPQKKKGKKKEKMEKLEEYLIELVKIAIILIGLIALYFRLKIRLLRHEERIRERIQEASSDSIPH